MRLHEEHAEDPSFLGGLTGVSIPCDRCRYTCIAPQACTAAGHMIARRICQCLPRRRVGGQFHPGGCPLRCSGCPQGPSCSRLDQPPRL